MIPLEDEISDETDYMPVYHPEPPEILAHKQIGGLLTEIDAAEMLAQGLEGLKVLHANEIVLGDLFHGNISRSLVDQIIGHRVACICGFGEFRRADFTRFSRRTRPCQTSACHGHTVSRWCWTQFTLPRRIAGPSNAQSSQTIYLDGSVGRASTTFPRN